MGRRVPQIKVGVPEGVLIQKTTVYWSIQRGPYFLESSRSILSIKHPDLKS